MKNVIILAEGFEEIEAVTIIDILRRLNIDLTIVGLKDRAIKGAHNILIHTDTTLDQINFDTLDSVIIPGGHIGANTLRENDILLEGLRRVHANKKLCAAICAGPIVLARAGILHRHHYTCYPGCEHGILPERNGILVKDRRVVCDENIITANGPGSAFEFAYAIGEHLGCADEVPGLKRGMLY